MKASNLNVGWVVNFTNMTLIRYAERPFIQFSLMTVVLSVHLLVITAANKYSLNNGFGLFYLTFTFTCNSLGKMGSWEEW